MTDKLQIWQRSDSVIEAAPEKLDLKREIFKQPHFDLRAGDAPGVEYFIVQHAVIAASTQNQERA